MMGNVVEVMKEFGTLNVATFIHAILNIIQL